MLLKTKSMWFQVPYRDEVHKAKYEIEIGTFNYSWATDKIPGTIPFHIKLK